MTASLAERAAAIVEALPSPPTAEAVLAAQDQVEALAVEAGEGPEIDGIRDQGHMLEMIADYVLDPAAPSEDAGLGVLAAWQEAEHPRIPHGPGGGEFAHLPGTQTPSQFRHPDTGHPMGKTEIGDTFEQLFKARGMRVLRQAYPGPFERTSGEGGPRNAPLDFRIDHTWAGELKTLNRQARNQKTAIKREEAARKEAAAEAAQMRPLLLVQVVDMERGRVEVYAHEAFSSKAVRQMTHLGGYRFTPGDFQAAQEATGHWAKRRERAGLKAAVLAAAGDWPPVDEAPEPGDTVIELRDGVPWIYTQGGPQAEEGAQ